MQVSPDDFLKLTKLLNEHKIPYKVQIFDLQAVINRQDDAYSKTLPWYKKYHKLDEVNILYNQSLGTGDEDFLVIDIWSEKPSRDKTNTPYYQISD